MHSKTFFPPVSDSPILGVWVRDYHFQPSPYLQELIRRCRCDLWTWRQFISPPFSWCTPICAHTHITSGKSVLVQVSRVLADKQPSTRGHRFVIVSLLHCIWIIPAGPCVALHYSAVWGAVEWMNKAPRAGVHAEGQGGETGGRLMAPGPDPPSIQTWYMGSGPGRGRKLSKIYYFIWGAAAFSYPTFVHW